MQNSSLPHRQLRKFNVWIEWGYTEENPFPKLEGDPLVHVRFKDGSASTDDGIGVRQISGWHD